MVAPNFLVAGTARAGTTALIEGLRLHPDVFITQPKEPHYFAYHQQPLTFAGPGDDQWVNKVVVNDRESYLDLFSGGADAVARGDGSVTTMYFARRAVPEVLKLNPAMRVVVILREPVDRAYSSFTYLRLRGVEPETDFLQAVALEEARTKAGWHHMWHYTAMSRYAEDLAVLFEGLGRDRVGVWFYDDLQTDYNRVLAEVVDFLDLPAFADGPPSLPRINASGRARSALAQRAVRWATRHEPVRQAVKRVIPFERREQLRSSILHTSVLDDDAAAVLRPQFSDDLRALSTLLDNHHSRPAWVTAYDR